MRSPVEFAWQRNARSAALSGEDAPPEVPETPGEPGTSDAPAEAAPAEEPETSGTATSDTATIETEETEEPLPVFYQYEVQPGDTASQIAAQFGISTDYIVWNNVNVIDDANSLAIGAVLQVPSIEGIIHSVRVGETVSGIAVEYDSTTQEIVDFESNGFEGNADNLPVGALILVPGGRRVPPPPPETPPSSEPSTDPSSPSWTPPALVPAAPSWVWPATGRLTNVFSPRHPLGIDISMIVNTPVAAASGGQVTFVGGNPCCSYGYHVIIEHEDGLETLYAHLNEIHVSSGQWVGAGEIIGGSGNTGYSTGPHLHFELRKNGIYSDPLGYLP